MKKFLAFLVLFTATCSVPVATCSVPVALATGEKTPEFHMKLTVKGCQVGELHIGCKAGATVGYDKGQDIYVPPAAIQGGTIGLLIEGDPLPLYQNIRPAAPCGKRAENVQWQKKTTARRQSNGQLSN